jgi:hypothetical protein
MRQSRSQQAAQAHTLEYFFKKKNQEERTGEQK